MAVDGPAPTPQVAGLHSCAAPQMDEVTGQLKTNNMKLKGMVTKVRSRVSPFVSHHCQAVWHALTPSCSGAQMRSTRNFCLDVILICIILGLVMYLVALFKK